MNLLGNNDNYVVLSVVTASTRNKPATATAAAAVESESSNLSSTTTVISNKSTRAKAPPIPRKGSSYQQGNGGGGGGCYLVNPFSENTIHGQIIGKMDFVSEDMNANLVHHQNNLHLQQQHHHQSSSVDDISDLRPNSLNNILKNNIISSGSHSPGLLLPDINNNSSNDLNLNSSGGDDGLSQSNSLTHGNVSVNSAQ